MLIRIGAHKGVNTDQLQSWTYVPAPEPEPVPPPEPEADAVPQEGTSASATVPEPVAVASSEEPALVGLSTLTLVFTGSEMVLEGAEADGMQGYLRGKVGSVV